MRAIDLAAQTNRWRNIAAGEKAFASLGMMAIALTNAQFTAQIVVMLLMTGLVIFGAGIEWRVFLEAARVPLLFILTAVTAQLVSLDHDGWMPHLALVDPETMRAAAFVALRSTACVAALLFLALTTPLVSLLHLCQRLGLNADISDIAMIMFRFVWLLLDCLEAGQKSLAARLGFSSRRRMLKSSALLAAGLFPRVFDRARRTETGLAARGFDGKLRFLTEERLASSGNLLLIAASLTGLAACLWWLP
jgi:cobalt/nickel transport system permease protein